ncbi:MAG: hydrogenase, partial [Paracoccaceae bacterium]|nr:hydrogenase [Paracoccaceae bacterium]
MRKFLLQGLGRRPLTEPAPLATDAGIEELGRTLTHTLRRLGRSLSIRVVDAGSCNGCELELNALANPFYDLERF